MDRSDASRPGSVRPGVELTLTALMAALTGVLAWISIPMPFLGVPFTGQTLGVMVAGLLLGPRLGAMAMSLYLLMGAIGLPVFAGGQSGMGVLLGPTAGFLLGFVPSAFVAGWSARRLGERSVARLAMALVPAVTMLFVCGSLWPWMTMDMGFEKVFLIFVAPFLPVEMMKVALVAPLANRLLMGLPALPGNFRESCTNGTAPG